MLSRQLTHRTLIRYDRNIGHLFVPNLVMRQPHSEKPYFVRTNAQGFRSNVDFTHRAKEGELRIAFIGDSFTAGEGVANEKRFSDLVSAAFGAIPYNFALSASGVDQQYLIYKDIAAAYDHDVLVLSPHIINIYRNLQSERLSVEGQSGKKLMVPKPYFTLENGVLVRHHNPVPMERREVDAISYDHKLIRTNERLRSLFHRYVPKPLKERMLRYQFKEHQGYESESDPRWQLMKALLKGIIETAGNRPVILAPMPYHQVYKNPPYRKRFEDLAAEYPNVTYVDILDKFKTVKNTDDLDFRKDEHYSEYGNEMIAEKIIDAISAKGILQKKNQQPAAQEVKRSGYVLGISAFYHDAAAALLQDGEIVAAAQEERFSRVKNDARFPASAINFCLEKAGIGVNDLQAIVFYDHPFCTLERIVASQITAYPKGAEVWEELVPNWVQTKMHIPDLIREALGYTGKVKLALHHLSHAASAYYASPYQRAAILTIDGVGEWATATIAKGEGNRIEMMQEMHFPHSVGLLYSAFTFYTGFKVNEGEYKLMGLAPYGEPEYADLIKKEIVQIHDDGSIELNMKYFDYQQKLCMISPAFEELFGGPARKQDEPITRRIRNIARSIQAVTEEIVVKMARHAKKMTGADHLCMAGGVALNCVANGKILEEKIFDSVWIQPAAGDAGGALGAALAYYYAEVNPHKERPSDRSPQGASCLGPSFSDDEIRAYLDSFGYRYHVLQPEERNKVLAGYLAEGKIAGHFQGGVEYGPRALGARSILGDPRSETTQSSLNLKIKFRESFRPFAPVVLEEDTTRYFNLHQPSPYMLIVAQVNEDRCIRGREEASDDLFTIVNRKRSDLPAITHVDYSARIQTVNPQEQPVFYDVISEFKKITGYGVIINTSFNVNGEPIVCTPRDAVNCFMHTHMDVLVMNNFLLLKEEQTAGKPAPSLIPAKKQANPEQLKKRREIQDAADQLLSRYFPGLEVLKPLISKHTKGNGTSNWLPFPDQPVLYNGFVTAELSPETILRHWKVLNQAAPPPELAALLKDLLQLSKKYRLEADAARADVSDIVYVMF